MPLPKVGAAGPAPSRRAARTAHGWRARAWALLLTLVALAPAVGAWPFPLLDVSSLFHHSSAVVSLPTGMPTARLQARLLQVIAPLSNALLPFPPLADAPAPAVTPGGGAPVTAAAGWCTELGHRPPLLLRALDAPSPGTSPLYTPGGPAVGARALADAFAPQLRRRRLHHGDGSPGRGTCCSRRCAGSCDSPYAWRLAVCRQWLACAIHCRQL